MEAVLPEPPATVQEPTPGQARLAVTLFFLVSGFGFATWASRIPTIQHRLKLNEAELGGVPLAGAPPSGGGVAWLAHYSYFIYLLREPLEK